MPAPPPSPPSDNLGIVTEVRFEVFMDSEGDHRDAPVAADPHIAVPPIPPPRPALCLVLEWVAAAGLWCERDLWLCVGDIVPARPVAGSLGPPGRARREGEG